MCNCKKVNKILWFGGAGQRSSLANVIDAAIWNVSTWCRCFLSKHDALNLDSPLLRSRSLWHRGHGSGGAAAGEPDQSPALAHHLPAPRRQHALPKVAPASARPAHLEQPSLWQAPSVSHRPVNCPTLKTDWRCGGKKKNTSFLPPCALSLPQLAHVEAVAVWAGPSNQ